MDRFPKKTSKTKINKKKKNDSGRPTKKKKNSKTSFKPSKKSSNKTISKTPILDEMRLNKYLATSGICSRRKADEYIEEGLVKVNGKTVAELGRKINLKHDAVVFKGKLIKPVKDYTYLVMFKPRNFLTTLEDPHERPTIKLLIPKKYKKLNLFPVGRLDWQSEGLLILTNDGDYAQSILHPKKEVPKTYEVKVEGKVPKKNLDKLLTGVTIPGGRAHATYVEVIKKSQVGTHTWIKISVTEGRNRLIRKMFDKLGHTVMRLRRVQIGSLKVSHLKAGDCAELSETRKDLVFEKPKTRP